MGVAALKDNTTGYSNVVIYMNGYIKLCKTWTSAQGASTGDDNAFLVRVLAITQQGRSQHFYMQHSAGVSMTSGSKNVIIGKYTRQQRWLRPSHR